MDWLTHVDERAFLALNGIGRPALDWFFLAVTWLGHGVTLAVVVLGPMALFDRAKLRHHALAMVLAVSLGSLVGEGIKWAADRDRPPLHFAAAVARGEAQVRTPGSVPLDHSLPSGHTQAAFGAATYVSLLYPRWSPAAFAGALLVAFSRVYLGVHFPLDVLTGALLGTLFSLAGFSVRERLRSRHRSSRSTAG